MASLSFRKVNKIYHDKEIIHDFSMEVKDGEFLVIVGPSGCGKSTLLRMIAGLEEITRGEIAIDGKVINQLTPKNRNVAMVFQNYALYPHMTVYANMAYGLRMRKRTKKDIHSRVIKTAKLLELSGLLKRKPRELSGGQRQRVAMGRAIVREPQLFLFDEPLSNLDAKLRVQMRLQIKKLQQTLKTTSIYVTHDQVEAMTLADRLVVLNKGYVEQIGTPTEVYEKPASKFVGGFMGYPAMNFIPGTIGDDRRRLILKGGTSLVCEIENKNLTSGTEVIVGIRPENLHIGKHEEHNNFRCKVSHIETLGADSLVYGLLPNNEKLITIRVDTQMQPSTGETVDVWCKSKRLHLFDKENRLRLEI